MPPPSPHISIILPECAYKGRAKKFDGPNAPNSHKSGQFNEPVVQIAANKEASDKTDIESLVSALTQELATIKTVLQKSQAATHQVSSPTKVLFKSVTMT